MTKKALCVSASTIALFTATAAYAASSGLLMPTGDGAYKQWTPKSGTTHYTMVDDRPCNGNTDWVKSNATGRRDSYSVNLSSVPNNSTITDILISPCASNDLSFGTNANIQVFFRWNGVNTDTCTYNLSGTTPVQKGNCDTGVSLLKTASSTLQVGVKYNSGTKGAKVSNVITELLY